MADNLRKLNNRDLLIYVAGRVEQIAETMKDHETRIRLNETAILKHQTEQDDKDKSATRQLTIVTAIAAVGASLLDCARHAITGK